MDLRRPLTTVTPTLDGDALAVLAGGDVEMSGREVHRLAGRGSEHGMRKVLDRLAAEGVVLRRSAGQANLYKLNRDHLAAAAIESLAGLRQELLRRMRAAVDAWDVAAEVVVLFGSAARGAAERGSDIDLLVVRQDAVDSEDATWRTQLTSLAEAVTAWTGNDTRLLEYSRAEYAGGRRRRRGRPRRRAARRDRDRRLAAIAATPLAGSPLMARTRVCDRVEAQGRLRKAEQFWESAELIREFADEESDVGDAYVTLAVLAGIAAADTVCCLALGRHAQGDDHQEAAKLLAAVRPDGKVLANSLAALLGVKTKAGYSHRPVSRADRGTAQRHGAKLLQAARDRFSGLG